MGMEKSAATRQTKAAKSSHGIFHVPTVNDSHDKQPVKDLSSERKPAKVKHENLNNTRAATKSAQSSQQNGLTSTGKATSSAVNSQSSTSKIFEGRTFCFSNSFSHDPVCYGVFTYFFYRYYFLICTIHFTTWMTSPSTFTTRSYY